jgi:hypothetical protein
MLEEELEVDDGTIEVAYDCEKCPEPVVFRHHGEENDLETLFDVIQMHNRFVHP